LRFRNSVYQRESRYRQKANLLPAPEGRFITMLRHYWPKQRKPSILDGTWKPPAIKIAI
jgi:hypothetical protein